MTSLNEGMLTDALVLAQQQLQSFAQSENFWSVFDSVFGTEYDRAQAEAIQQAWQTSDFSQLPEIQVLDSASMPGIQGGFSAETGKIYINADFLANATAEQITAVLIEEISHSLDSRINTSDTPGDEGELFAALVNEETLSSSELAFLKTEDDTSFITLDGQQIPIEESHFRGASLSWETTSGNTVKFTLEQSWRRSAFGNPSVGQTIYPGQFSFGDGSSTNVNLVVKSIDVANDIVIGVAEFSRTYATPGNKTAFFQGGNRISNLRNNADGIYRTETVVNVGAANDPAVSGLPPIVQVADNNVVSFAVPAFDPNRDSFTFRLATSSEAGGFIQPPGLSIDSTTGVVTWDIRDNVVTTKPGDLWSAQVMIVDSQGAKTPVDFLIQIASSTNQAPKISGLPSSVNFVGGQPTTFVIEAFDPDSTTPVNLQALTPPTGMTLTPIAPSSTNPSARAFQVTWTPPLSQVGNNRILNFQVTDGLGVSTFASTNLIITNQVPVGTNDSYSIDEDALLLVQPGDGVLRNDADPDIGNSTNLDGDSVPDYLDADPNNAAISTNIGFNNLIASINTFPTNGTVTLGKNGSFVYKPNLNFYGVDSFTYLANDGFGNSLPTTVNITVKPINDVAALSSANVTLDETNAALSTGGKLSISDVDNAAEFVSQSDVVGSYGQFSIDQDGNWSYTANEAYNSLNEGDSVADTFTVKAVDGTETSVQVTINGTHDAAVLSSANVALDETNAALSTGGKLSISDVDNAAEFVSQSDVAGGYGQFSIGQDGNWSYTANEAYDSLNVGDSVVDTFTVQAVDGTETSVQVTINGTNDAAVLSSANITLDETNTALSTGGKLSISDVDNAAEFVAQSDMAGSHGQFSINQDGNWSYTANESFDELNVGQSYSDTFIVQAVDGTATSVQVTINGTNDAAVLSSANVSLDETNAALSTGGKLSISDVDNAAEFVAQSDVAGSYGQFSIDQDGNWSYTANESFDELNVGQSYSDTFIVQAVDGTATSVQVTINGTNDAAVLSSANVSLDETDVPLSTAGTLSISDVDNAAEFVPQSDVAGDYGQFSIDKNGDWSYTANEAYDSLNEGDSVADTFTVKAVDGTETSVQVTINGTNDAAVLSLANVALDETNAALSTSGTLSISDVDNVDEFVVQSDVVGEYGQFSIDKDGNWSYTANEAYNSFNVGDSVADTFTVKAVDGTETSVQVTINGTNDAAVLSSANVTLDETNTALSTSGKLSISDVDNVDEFVAQSDMAGSYGQFSIDQDGNWSYTANEAYNSFNVGDSVADTFTVKAVDGTATSVQVTINGTNDAPTATNDSLITSEDTPLVISASTLLGNDVDVDLGDILSVSEFIQPSQGGLVDNGNGTYTYTPNANYNGGDSFTYTVRDREGATSTATVNLTVNAVNDNPDAINDIVTARQSTAKTILVSDLLANDGDIEGDALSLTQVQNAQNGTVALDSNGNVVFTANANVATASFEYTLSDGKGGTDIAFVSVLVGMVDDGGNGQDTMNGTAGDDVLNGGNGDDILRGFAGDDKLLGGNGIDNLQGGEGKDWLYGGRGNDLLNGGLGRDTFVLISQNGTDTIQDFTDGADQIGLVEGLTFGQLTVSSSNGNTLIAKNGGDVLAILSGVNSSLITQSDFINAV